MKHLVLLSFFTFHFALFTQSASAAVPLKWTVETSRLAPAVFDVVRGETIALEAAFNSAGKPFAMDGEPVSIFWQTNGMGNAWWTAPAVATSNLVRATFTPEMDPGAATVNGFLGSSGSIYRAAFTFRFRHGPGAVPNTLPLPVPVIDFAKVRVINPPWSGGGGGGVDTNATIDIIHATVDGEGRYLPPYLHYLEMDDTYPDAAAEWYAQSDYSHGSCSSVRDGNTLSRNYDWNFNFMPEFVVRIPSGPTIEQSNNPNNRTIYHRFASIAVCNVGTNLTEADVVSGKWSKWYKALPGHAVDGVNENGVVCEVNVCPTNGVEGWTGTVVHCLGGVRYALDHATNAAHAASLLAEKVYVPQGYGNFHYMVADATSTYIVENGSAHAASTGVPVLTNFRLYPTRDTSGEGQERYDALVSGANITSQWWTLTYTPGGYRASDLQGITGDDLNQLFNYWENNPRESHRGETIGDQSWWQTVHTSVYDISNRVLRVAVQETDDWYTFAVGQANVDAYTKSETDAKLTSIAAQLSSLKDGKRDKTDMTAWKNVADYTSWTFVTQPTLPAGFSLEPSPYVELGGAHITWDASNEEHTFGYTFEYFGSAGDALCTFTCYDLTGISFTAMFSQTPVEDGTLTKTSATSGLAKIVANGKLTKAEKSSTSDDPANADYRDPQDNTCHKTEFTEWTSDDAPAAFTEPMFDSGERAWFTTTSDSSEMWIGVGTENSTSVKFYEESSPRSFTATRSAVCTENKRFVTYDVVDGKVSAAVSTNNPAFVSAVRAISPSSIRTYDSVRQCWWSLEMVNGVPTWTVED